MATMKYRCRFCYKREGHNRRTCPSKSQLRTDIKSLAERVQALRPWRRSVVLEWWETQSLIRLLGLGQESERRAS